MSDISASIFQGSSTSTTCMRENRPMRQITKRLALVAMILPLGGCGTTPKNAQDFRQAMRDGASYHVTIVESFKVARPFQDVAATLRKKSSECLAVAVNWDATNKYGNTRSGTQTFKPTFVGDSKRAELHLQRKRQGGGQVDVGAPPDGFYWA